MQDDQAKELAIRDAYYAKAKEATLETLQALINELITGPHDYSTICYAISAGMTATMVAMNNHPNGGITGFQAGCIMWEVLQQAFHKSPPLRLVEYEWALFPQYSDRFNTIPPESWKWLREEAKRKIEENAAPTNEYKTRPEVLNHWQSIADGKVPFGLKVMES